MLDHIYDMFCMILVCYICKICMRNLALLLCLHVPFFRSGLETGDSVVYFPILLSLSVASSILSLSLSLSAVLTPLCPFHSEFPLVVWRRASWGDRSLVTVT